MQSYINKFNIAINGNRSEVLINFSQAVPQIPSQVTLILRNLRRSP